MNSTVFNLKKCIFPFIMMFTLIIFGFRGLTCLATETSSSRVISINKETDISKISVQKNSILKLSKDVTSLDLSKLPKVDKATPIVIWSDIDDWYTTLKLENSLPDNYELPLLILYDNVAKFTNKTYNPSLYYLNQGTEKNPDILLLNASNFDLSLLPDKDSKTYLCIMDMCETPGIDFGDSVLPQNYVVSQIFILNEQDKQTFKNAFQNVGISVMSVKDMKKKLIELFTVEDTSKNDTTMTSDNSENKTSSSNSNSNTTKTDSNKTTGDDLNSIYFLGGTFILFGAVSLIFRKNRSY